MRFDVSEVVKRRNRRSVEDALEIFKEGISIFIISHGHATRPIINGLENVGPERTEVASKLVQLFVVAK